jgi:hypothetical protein
VWAFVRNSKDFHCSGVTKYRACSQFQTFCCGKAKCSHLIAFVTNSKIPLARQQKTLNLSIAEKYSAFVRNSKIFTS